MYTDKCGFIVEILKDLGKGRVKIKYLENNTLYKRGRESEIYFCDLNPIDIFELNEYNKRSLRR